MAKYEAYMAGTTKVAKPSPAAKKPAVVRPYKDFPLYAHQTGRWAKTIKRHTSYFGRVDDWKAALDRRNRSHPVEE